MAEKQSSWRDFLPLGAVFAMGLMLAISSFAALRGYYQTIDRQQFRRSATYYSTSFKDDVARHLTSLAAIRAFVSASRVSRWEFSTFAHQILPQNSGFKAVLWIPKVTAAGRKAYETALQNDGLFGLTIHEIAGETIVAAADRADYLPITYVEPFDANEHLVGLDLSQVPHFAQMFGAAQKSGRVAASEPSLQSLIAGVHGPAVMLAFPLRPEAAGDAAQGLPEGYALAVLQLQALVDESMAPSGTPVQAAIAYRDGERATPVVFTADGAGRAVALDKWFGPSAFSQAVPFDIGDRHFLLALRSTGQADPVTHLYVPAGAALLVLALTALLAQNMLATILRKQLVERAVVARTSELVTANQSLLEEVEQRRLAEAELRLARDKAENASRAKTSFLATMSHELRTPLNAIIGFSSILAQAPETPRQAEYSGEILGSGKRLLDLINDILDLTHMDSEGAAAAGDDAIYLDECIETVIGDLQPAAKAAGVMLKAAVPPGLPALHGESKRLTRALWHLVANAITFTPQGGAAVVTASTFAEESLIVDVIDTGVGTAPEAQEKIREVFSQQDGRLARRFEGVGLGLTYVRKVMELHGANLAIVSEVNKGTRVRLVFPRHRLSRSLEVA